MTQGVVRDGAVVTEEEARLKPTTVARYRDYLHNDLPSRLTQVGWRGRHDRDVADERDAMPPKRVPPLPANPI